MASNLPENQRISPENAPENAAITAAVMHSVAYPPISALER